ncbi:MAG: excinuclease ABC subunit UvrC [Alphaproteobacteria bacterium]|nr:excinuclease ABC subunit UvrC [Alphaproteobacteria bacterium]
MPEKPPNPLEKGANTIREYVTTLADAPGVYRMVSEGGEILYIGKARSLKKRVTSYTRPAQLPHRLQRMIALTHSMEFIRTHTEVEALLLEMNMIKTHQPRFNVLLKDDKSFPYLFLTGDHDYPQILSHRGAKKRKGDYFGPFASGGSIIPTLITLQKVFKLRNCTDSFFAARKRPCLQYHIKRCTAPCVGLVSKDEYAEQVKEAKKFLQGKTQALQADLSKQMQFASDNQDFETAAELRDRIKALSAVQTTQDISLQGVEDADIITLVRREGRSCIQVFFIRAGHNYGNRAFFPRHQDDEENSVILGNFMAQFYVRAEKPPRIIVSEAVEDHQLLEEWLNADISIPQRGVMKRLVDFGIKNAEDALRRNMAEKASEQALLEKVRVFLGLDDLPQRIEVYDNSHSAGTNMVGAFIAAGPEGLNKKAYRKFNIKTADKSDDYGMMREVIERRFKNQEDMPDIVVLDGGVGQLNAAKEVLLEMGLLDHFLLMAISKGPDRNAGREWFHFTDREAVQLPVSDAVLHYFQRLRDEAHRFAIGSHRARRQKTSITSSIDEIPDIGPKRKKALLAYFGSAKDVSRAGVVDLMRVEGISKTTAEKIYNFYNEN